MPLVSIAGELAKAKKGGYALPSFNVFEMKGCEGVFEAIEGKRAPAIVGIFSGTFNEQSSPAFAAFIRSMAEKPSVPVSLMLDHGTSFEQCLKAISLGFTDVMYDGSQLPLEGNIVTTRLVVHAAHAAGVCVEAELGHVGMGSDYATFGAEKKGFTDPAAAERFVAETEVDFLAVAIGNAHGVDKGKSHLDMGLLKEIRKRVDIPLVLHGGSGLSEEQFKSAIQAGISKVNITTDFLIRAASSI
ncbi:MAG: class II fructose-bisphosphate aldolase [Thermodesulfobacteriota bacterium]|jgi:fructose-bisphosphate aldolase class II